MRIAFLGTPEFSVPTLAELVAAGHEVAAVYAQPPRPRGRGQAVQPSPVHAFADSLGLPVFTPASMRDPAETAAFAALDLDAAVVVAFGQILPRAVLDAPRLGCFNLHASLLPRWRGAAPIQRAIMAGDRVTGVQVMRMSEGLDEGPVLLSESVRIDALDTAGALHDRLSRVGAHLAPRALASIERGSAVETPQASEGVVYARKISPAEARVHWSAPAAVIDCHIRGLSPFPGAWFEAPSDKGPVRVKALLSQAEEGGGAPGEVLDDGLLVACGEGAVRLLQVQRAGGGVQDAEAFLRGFPLPGWRDLELMPRYRLIVEYDGGPYRGYQAQADLPSVQSSLQRAILGFCGETPILHAAGRTDTGVHAEAQVVTFDLIRTHAPDTVRNAINAHLGHEPISVLDAAEVAPDFHARFSAKGRRYRYRILNRRAPPALDRGRVWHVKKALDFQTMDVAAGHLIGHHDFTTFRDAQCQARSPMRTLDVAKVERIGEEIHLTFAARSFLHRQVRSMAGTLVEVGAGRWSAGDVREALSAADRQACGPVAPADGLYFVGVDY